MHESSSALETLKNLYGYVHSLFAMRHLLNFDMAAHMPGGALHAHLKALAVLNGHIYTSLAEDGLRQLIDKARKEVEAASSENRVWEIANLDQMLWMHDHHAAVPRDVYRQHIEVSMVHDRKFSAAQSCESWEEVLPYLQEVLDLYRRIADLKQERLGTDTPYGALIEGFAPGYGEVDLDALFSSILPALSDLREQARQASAAHAERAAGAETPKARPDRQSVLNASRRILGLIGFDYARGEMMVSRAGPMAAGIREDMRVLIRCPENAPSLDDALTDVLYQGAGAIYAQSIPEEWKDQPVGQPAGKVLASAVALVMETIIGRSRPFLSFIARPSAGWESAESMYARRNAVSAGPLRNGADEISKFFHDLLRFRIERDLFAGKLTLAQVPERWGEESESLLGARPSSVKEGPLQNPDWFSGRYGYIGSSPLSQLLAAQIFETMTAAHPELLEEIGRGDFRFVRQWLSGNIFRHARSKEWKAIASAATDYRRPDADAFSRHARRRYIEAEY